MKRSYTPSELTAKAGLEPNQARTIRFAEPIATFYRLCGVKGWERAIMVYGMKLEERNEGKSFACIIYKEYSNDERLLNYLELPGEARKAVCEAIDKEFNQHPRP